MGPVAGFPLVPLPGARLKSSLLVSTSAFLKLSYKECSIIIIIPEFIILKL